MKKKFFFVIVCILFFSSLCNGITFSEGIKFFQKRKYNQAIKSFEKSLKESPEKVETYYYLGYCYYTLKNYNKAEKNFITFLKNPEKVKDNYKIKRTLDMLYYIYRRKKEWDKIIDLNTHIFEKMKNDKKFKKYISSIKNQIAYAYYNKGSSYFWRQNYEKAEGELIKAKQFNPDATYIRGRLGECLFKKGEKEKAKEEFLYVLKREKNNWYLIVTSAYYLLNSGVDLEKLKKEELTDLPEKIITSYIFLLKNDKKGFDILVGVEKEKKAKGEITFNSLRKIYPEINNKTVDYYIEFIKRYPFSRRNEWILRTIYRSFRRDKDRIEELKKEISKIIDEKVEENKNNPEVGKLVYLKVKMEYEGEIETEERLRNLVSKYEEIIEKYPESKFNTRILREISSILKDKLKDYKKCIFYLDKLSQKGDINCLLDLSDCYSEIGEYEKAEESLFRYLEEKKGDVKGKIKLAFLYLKEGRVDEGMRIFEKLEGKIPEDYREEIKNKKEEYRKVEDKYRGKDMGFIEITEIKRYFTDYISLDEKIPVISRQEKNFEIGYISENKKKKNFIVKFISEIKPSLSEPETIFIDKNGKWIGEWEGILTATEFEWYKILPFEVIHRWKEKRENIVKVERILKENNNEKTMEINISLPDNNWNMEIKISRWILRNIKIKPEPDEKYSSSILYRIKDKNFKVILEGTGMRTYPEIILRKKEQIKEYELGKSVINFKNETFEIKNDDCTFYNMKFFNERIFNLAEKRIE